MHRFQPPFALLCLVAVLTACQPPSQAGGDGAAPASEAPGPSRIQADKRRPTKEEAIQFCEAFMGFQKNECLDRVRRDYAQIVA